MNMKNYNMFENIYTCQAAHAKTLRHMFRDRI